jgi:protein ImuB
MAFASIYVPNFILQAVLCAEPTLRGRAVALLDGTPPLGSVVAVNDSARQAGIEIGMTEPQAAQFCGVEKRNRSRTCEESLHIALLQMGWTISPRIEDTALDTIILDLAGLRRFFGSQEKIARELTRRAAELGLAVNIAIAANIDVAVHAARGFAGITFIPRGEEAKRLGRLPVRTLSPSDEILETLERWGVSTCAELAALPVLQLSERLGQEGVRLHGLARGASVRSLVLGESEMRFEEEIELEDAVEELEPLAFLLGRLLDQLCARLQAHALAAAAIHLRFTLGDAFEKEPSAPGKAPAAEIVSKIYEKTMRLPVPMRDSKLLLNLLRLRLQADPPQASILRIALTAEPERRRAVQNGLFRRNCVDPEKLELTIARLANLVGSTNVGSPEIMDTHRPGAFRMKRFAPAPNEVKFRRKTGHAIAAANRKAEDESKPRRATVALRNFRPEWLARIKLRGERPLHILFRGMRGRIVAASGPWRTSGDWWQEEEWRHDEWDIYIRFDFGATSMGRDLPEEMQDGLYRIYYDGLRRSWFVRARYD